MSHLNDQLEKQMELLNPDFKEELPLEQNILDSAMGRPLSESLEKWHKESQEQSETPQTEIVEMDKETAETRDEMELAMDEMDVANDKTDMTVNKAELEFPLIRQSAVNK